MDVIAALFRLNYYYHVALGAYALFWAFYWEVLIIVLSVLRWVGAMFDPNFHSDGSLSGLDFYVHYSIPMYVFKLMGLRE